MDQEKKTSTKVSCGEGFVGDAIHFGFITHVGEQGVVEHTGSVQTNVGRHEHEQGPYPSD